MVSLGFFLGVSGLGGADSLATAVHLLGERVGEHRGDWRVVDEVEVQHCHKRRVACRGTSHIRTPLHPPGPPYDPR